MMCTQKAHKCKIEMSKFVSPRGLSTFFENFRNNFPEVIDHSFLWWKFWWKNPQKNDQWSHVLYHNFINFDAIRLKAKYFRHLIVIPMRVEQKIEKISMCTHTAQKVKNWLKIHFLRVCLLCAHTVGQLSYIESSNTPLWHISISLGKPWRL